MGPAERVLVLIQGLGQANRVEVAVKDLEPVPVIEREGKRLRRTRGVGGGYGLARCSHCSGQLCLARWNPNWYVSSRM